MLTHVYNYQGELAIYLCVINPKVDTLKLFLQHNYRLNTAAKLDYDGTGGKTLVKVAIDKGHYELLKIFADLGFIINFPPQTTTLDSAEKQPSGSEAENSAAVQKFVANNPPVRTLKQFCRRVIRNEIGFGIHEKLKDILLPVCLKDFILLRDILH